jgi:hypothetical protein
MSVEIELDFEALRRGNIKSGFYRLRSGLVSVPVRYHRGTNDTLIVIFHGAVDQSKRSIPRYPSILRDLLNCHQLSIADQTLELNSGIRSGWYIGGVNMPLQEELPVILKGLFESIGAKHRIYLGGSSGGFAALYYSLVDPESICIAVNPQTNLSTYLHNATLNYLNLAWNGAGSFGEIDDRVFTNMAVAYGNGFRNMVIYLQSAGDIRHYKTQMADFCKVGLKSPEQFILNCGYWGIPGHSNSIPSKDYYLWVKAIVAAPWFDRQAILNAYYILSTQTATFVAKPVVKKDDTEGSKNIQFADLLSDLHLRQPLKD